MDRPEKVATPEATVTAEPPLRVPPAGLVPMARLTVVALSAVSMLPLASSTATVTAGVMVAPAAVFDGPWTKASLAGGPVPVMVKAAEVAAVYDGELAAVSVYPVPALLMDRPEKVATPEATVTAATPLSVPPAGLVPMARLTVVALSEVSMLPLASSTATFTAGVMVAPAAVLAGPWTNASSAGGPTPVMLKAAEVAAV